MNLYGFAFNAPPNWSDRDGLDNIYNPSTGQNAPPNLGFEMPVGGGPVDSGYLGNDFFLTLPALTIPFMTPLGVPFAIAEGLNDANNENLGGMERVGGGLRAWGNGSLCILGIPRLASPVFSFLKPCKAAKGPVKPPWSRPLTPEQRKALFAAMQKGADNKYRTGGFNAEMYKIMLEQGATPTEAYNATFGRFNKIFAK